jgi:TetR/AcrR family transcriptional regulator, transcriptional repressor for nem operon
MRHHSELSDAALRVLDVAEGLVQQHGYNGFSYDDIASVIGIKKPSIHHHFATKAELVATVAQRYTDRFGAELKRIDEMAMGAVDKLRAYAALFARTYARDRRLCVCGMLGAEGDALPEAAASEVTRFFTENIDWLAAVLSKGQRAGQIRRSGKPRAQAELVLSCLEGAMVIGRAASATGGPSSAALTLIAQLQA